MLRPVRYLVVAAAVFCLSQPAFAHFGMVIPDSPVITQNKRSGELFLSFSHPFELIGMELERPAKFSVTAGKKTTDLLPTLEPAEVMQHKAWKSRYRFTRPGIYRFVMEPTPYWEPSEDISIIHYTQTIIPAYGDDEGWDSPLGLPTEIVPLLRPFGNYAGNSFTGQVLVGGSPAPGAEVEVEFYNRDKRFSPPNDYHITQVVKADDRGVFNFTCPFGGWWGFGALSEADYTLKDPEGNDKGVELGAVLWIYMDTVQENKR